MRPEMCRDGWSKRPCINSTNLGWKEPQPEPVTRIEKGVFNSRIKMLLPRRTQQHWTTPNGRSVAVLTVLALHCSMCLSLMGNPSKLHQHPTLKNCLQHSNSLQQQHQQHCLQLKLFSNAESKNEDYNDSQQRSTAAASPQTEIFRFCQNNDIKSAVRVLEKWVEDEEDAPSETIRALTTSFTNILELLVNEKSEVIQLRTFRRASNILDKFLDRGANNSEWLPTAEVFLLLIQGWASTSPPMTSASERCCELINKQWSVYRQEWKKILGENDENNRKILQERATKLVPLKDSYYHAIRACSLFNNGWNGARRAANQAEKLMENMEFLSKDYPHLKPDRLIVNEVMWVKHLDCYWTCLVVSDIVVCLVPATRGVRRESRTRVSHYWIGWLQWQRMVDVTPCSQILLPLIL